MTDKAEMSVELDDDEEPLMAAVMGALEPLCRDPVDAKYFDGRRATEVMGACCAMIFAGIPKPLRAEQIDQWVDFVKTAAMRIDTGKTSAIRVMPREQ